MPKRPHRPKIFGWGITNRCNLACPHCYTSAAKRSIQELTTAEAKAVIDELGKLGTKDIGWTGGEPLLRDDLEELSSYARTRGITHLGLTTNGILLDERRARSLKKAGIKQIQISLDGSTTERNQAIRKASTEDFQKIMEAIRTCRRLNLNPVLAMLLAEQTLTDAPDFVRMAKKEGIEYVRYCGFVPLGRGRHREVVDRLQFKENRGQLSAFVQKALRSRKILQLFDPPFGPLPPQFEFHQCVAGMKVMYLSANGDVYPCTALLDKRFRIGNVRQRSIKEIWDDPKMREIALMPRGDITGTCRSCDHFSNCRGACRGVAFAFTGDLNASFPLCLKKSQENAEC